MKKIASILLTIMLLSVFQPSSYAGFLENELKYGRGVRPLGMGGAFTAVADDVNAIYYNPAGLSEQVFGYTNYNNDLHDYIYSSTSYNAINFGSIGFSGWKAKTNLGQKVEISTISMGTLGPAGLSWGVSYKNINWNDGLGDSSAWSGDVGFLLHLTPDLNIGMLSQDIVHSKEMKDIVPSTGRFAVAYRPFAGAMTLAYDIESGRSGDLGLPSQLGAEILLAEGFYVRAGNNRGRDTFGATLRLPMFDINYGVLTAKKKGEESLHALSFEFGIPPQQKRVRALIGPKEFVLIDVKGALVGGRGEFSLFGGTRTGIDNILASIRKAAKEDAIDGILLRISGFEAGLGSIGIVQELRSELKKFKKKGKTVVVYIESSSLGDEYYLASVADKIIAPKGASIGGLGRSIAITRVNKLMDTIGVEWQIIAQGKYKDTFNIFSDEMTKDQREMVSSLVSDMYRQMINDIADDRNIKVSDLKNIADGRMFTAEEAMELKLIDKIGYFEDAASVAKKTSKTKEDVRIVRAGDLQDYRGEFFFPWPNKIAVIEVDGEIITGRNGSNVIFGGTYVGADSLCEQIKIATDDFMVKAIILRVNSPGGSPIASGQIYQEIVKARKKGKVVVASMGDVAASGGYFVCAGADKIVADSGSITGSIGVIGAIPVLSELYKKLGVETEVIKEGKHSDMFSGLRKLTKEELKSLDKLSEETYIEFKRIVAEGRNMSTEEVEVIAQGRIYTGSQAKEIGLVDNLGGFSDAVDLSKKLAKISGEPQLIYYREDGFFMQGLMEISEKLGLKEGLLPMLNSSGLSEYKLNY